MDTPKIHEYQKVGVYYWFSRVYNSLFTTSEITTSHKVISDEAYCQIGETNIYIEVLYESVQLYRDLLPTLTRRLPPICPSESFCHCHISCTLYLRHTKLGIWIQLVMVVCCVSKFTVTLIWIYVDCLTTMNFPVILSNTC